MPSVVSLSFNLLIKVSDIKPKPKYVANESFLNLLPNLTLKTIPKMANTQIIASTIGPISSANVTIISGV